MKVSLYVLAYNHEPFIAAAIRAALSQDYSPLEVIVSDDCSTDETWRIIEAEVARYDGPHVVRTRRNARNLGVSAHINALWRECTGEWIVASAGDDCSSPTRVSRCICALSRHPRAVLVQSWLEEVDAAGGSLGINSLGTRLEPGESASYGLTARVARDTYRAHGAAMAYSRKLVDVFGSLPEGVIFEDNVLNVRAELLGEASVLAEPLVQHRNHPGQLTRLDGDVATRDRRLAARLRSDVITTRQNLLDLEVARASHDSVLHAKLAREFGRLHTFCRLKERAFRESWPARLIPAALLARFAFRYGPMLKDDWRRVLLPDRLQRVG